MKKIFLVLSVLAVLFFSVLPSQALVGMPDAVPGTDILQSFFVVNIAGGLDTLIVFTEVGGLGSAGATTSGRLDFDIYSKRSVHVGDYYKKYTHNDVVAVSVRDLIAAYVSSTNLTKLKYDLDGDGTVDSYVGYIYWTNTVGLATPSANNMIAKQYLVDLSNGKASGVNMAGKEQATTTLGHVAAQFDANGMEAFSGQALATSAVRERTDAAAGTATVSYFRLMPRYYLHDANASNYIFVWKSFNRVGTTDTWCIDFYAYDTEEVGISTTVCIPDELNILDVRDSLPPVHMASYPTAGWWDLRIPDIVGSSTFSSWNTCEFDAYSWQFANNAANNWAALFAVHRDAGTIE